MCFERAYRRYVGALIGIHSPQGEKVGQVSHTHNREMLFLATKHKGVYETLAVETRPPSDGKQLPLW